MTIEEKSARPVRALPKKKPASKPRRSAAKAKAAKPKGRPREFDRTAALVAALRLFWRLGYEPASVAALCREMKINPPSFYAAFGSKEALFIEAVLYYERAYWSEPVAEVEKSPKPLCEAMNDFFCRACDVLLSKENPSGCMVVLAAVNISPEEKRIAELVRRLRGETRAFFKARLERAKAEGELRADADAEGLADILNIILEGMSIQAKDGLDIESMKRAAKYASELLRPFVVERPQKA